MTKCDTLVKQLTEEFDSSFFLSVDTACNEVTVECGTDKLLLLMSQLRDHNTFQFDMLVDVCAVDYLKYGIYDWETNAATDRGFSRAVSNQNMQAFAFDKPRFAVVYHLLSTQKNQRLRVKAFVEESAPILPSVHTIWKGANWFEREAYDLYGILFEGHPDLRRILTDYGFIGHPFRKDFPTSGHVEMRYDASAQKVIYEPVDIEPRVTVPKVIRDDNRYSDLHGDEAQ